MLTGTSAAMKIYSAMDTVIEVEGLNNAVRVVRSPRQVGDHGGDNTRRAFIVVGAIFVTSFIALFYIYLKFPELESEEMQHMKIPWDIEDAKQLGRVLDRYKDKYFFEVMLTLIVTYIFLQTFAIPGSITLSILSGFLFPFPLALMLVCFCSATGASLCYVLSYFLGRHLVYRYFPEKASQWALTVKKHRSNLISYLLFLRMTPFLPNWFINITSPIIGVPLFPFWIGTFIGVAPPSFVAIQAGQTLYKLSASSDAWSWTSVILLGFFAALSLVPVLIKKRIKEAIE
ncbi:transmembrane protein 41B isoform X2 [Cryptotermes secundus]|uniref:transmembrane protein 41B isoform X2 n=1 Tax=Cryptotermes secundus TaxID=105785 RepID=UPI000CD7B2AC|nr:transmembrane protein 41B isoform X2 [Cryptotermes secundus]XP_023717272.1 transmembrane protein 41B isoform X2 [Cryptotermes secundus]XP_023717273.1 transmembrane protein 41B isoform X2 [Cryptotermes secundus]